jgi:hypothetical protein
MKLFVLIILAALAAGCATTYSLVKYERIGPVQPEIWRNNKTGKCERRVYLDSMYFVTEVPCP